MSVAAVLMFLLPLYNSIDTFIRGFYYECTQIWNALRSAIGPKSYIFFEDSGAPYWSVQVTPTASGSAKPEWVYLDDKRCFVEWGCTNSETKAISLPILSLEIIEKDKVLYDLTEFLEHIQVYSEKGVFPSILQLVGAWGLSSGIIVDMNRGFEFRIICNQANIHTVVAANGDSIHHVINRKKEEPVTASDMTTIEGVNEADESKHAA
jgi:hypothetical protein